MHVALAEFLLHEQLGFHVACNVEGSPSFPAAASGTSVARDLLLLPGLLNAIFSACADHVVGWKAL